MLGESFVPFGGGFEGEMRPRGGEEGEVVVRDSDKVRGAMVSPAEV